MRIGHKDKGARETLPGRERGQGCLEARPAASPSFPSIPLWPPAGRRGGWAPLPSLKPTSPSWFFGADSCVSHCGAAKLFDVF